MFQFTNGKFPQFATVHLPQLLSGGILTPPVNEVDALGSVDWLYGRTLALSTAQESGSRSVVDSVDFRDLQSMVELCNGYKIQWTDSRLQHITEYIVLQRNNSQPDGGYDSVDYYASANMWWGQKVHFAAYLIPSWPWPLTFWPQNLTRSSLPHTPIVVQVWSISVNKYSRYLATKVCTGRMDECKNTLETMSPATMLVEA